MRPQTPPFNLDDLQELLWGFAAPRVVTVASKLGLLRLLADTPRTGAEVADDLGLDALATAKVVRALTAIGLLEADGDLYRVSEAMRPFFRSGGDDLAPFLAHLHGMCDHWGANLEPWLRGEGWATHQRSAADIEAFGKAMRAMGTHVGRQVAGTLDLRSVTRVLDVGGGFGHFSRCLCDAKPDLEATVLDIPEVCELARAQLARSEGADRIDFIEGDYLISDYGRGYDLVLFANVLHQEQAENAEKMIRRGADAVAPGGRVAVVDFTIDDEQRQHLFGTLFAINMRSFGDTHTEPMIRHWLSSAGIHTIERFDLNTFRWLIVGSRDGRT